MSHAQLPIDPAATLRRYNAVADTLGPGQNESALGAETLSGVQVQLARRSDPTSLFAEEEVYEWVVAK